jgi:hypothetical protein
MKKITKKEFSNINWPLPSNAKPQDYKMPKIKFKDSDLYTYDMQIIMSRK